jgi:thymidine kinase
MAKLYFRHGTVGSAKTLNLLAVAHNYQQQGKTVLLLKPRLDDRFGATTIRSRAGLVKEAHVLIDDQVPLEALDLNGVHCILVDEAQFLSALWINHLRTLSADKGIPVICYGLRTDFKTHCFEGSLRLLELADSIEEVKTTCAFCQKKAIFNLKIANGHPIATGASIDLGTEEKYLPACAPCYRKAIRNGVLPD